MHEEAIRTFLRRDHGRVVRAVAVACGDRQRAEDAVQDALVDVWTKERRVEDLAGWVTTAALNRARSRWRTAAAERRAFDRLAARAKDAPHPESITEVDERIAAALKRLPRAQREVVALHYLLDMAVADVATQLDIAEGTVKSHLHRARNTLRFALADAPAVDLISEQEEVRRV